VVHITSTMNSKRAQKLVSYNALQTQPTLTGAKTL